MKKEFVMRGQTVSGGIETLNFSGFKPGMAYRLVEFSLFPTNLVSSHSEMAGSITASKNAMNSLNQDFNDEGLIGSTMFLGRVNDDYSSISIINDTFLITQNLLLEVRDGGGDTNPVNWQCKFEAVKMSGSEEAVTNYKQFLISDE